MPAHGMQPSGGAGSHLIVITECELRSPKSEMRNP
jgi:hypothetical protein